MKSLIVNKTQKRYKIIDEITELHYKKFNNNHLKQKYGCDTIIKGNNVYYMCDEMLDCEFTEIIEDKQNEEQ
jgi:hypothetical protein